MFNLVVVLVPLLILIHSFLHFPVWENLNSDTVILVCLFSPQIRTKFVFSNCRQPALLLLTVLELRIEQNSLLCNVASLHSGMRRCIFAKQWSKLFLILLHHLIWDENITFMSYNNIDVFSAPVQSLFDDESQWIFNCRYFVFGQKRERMFLELTW